jgi:CPA2 family monovalent cation:H+ antiporter-2
MTHNPLIATVVVGLVLAFVFGALAQRLRVSPLVGYLLAGVVVGPYTPGFVGDQGMASALAEIGVILLMFGVGLHFSLGSLLSVRSIAVPGALVQMSIATLLGMGLARLQGWPPEAGFIFGLALSVPST